MKVIIAGLPKTGTKSMHWALQTLGYSIYDFPENAFLLTDEYSKIMNEGWTSDDFRRMYENVDAAMDYPVSFFWEEISRAFPNAKIVLTIRDDEDTWFRSLERQIASQDGSVLWRFIEVFSPTFIKYKAWRNKMGPVFYGINSRSRFRWKTHLNESILKRIYRSHNAYVKHSAPSDRLLVYKCSEGWEPLCKFLGAPVPDEPFPHINKGASFTDNATKDCPLFRKVRNEGIVSFVMLVTATVAFGACIYKYGVFAVPNAIRNHVETF